MINQYDCTKILAFKCKVYPHLAITMIWTDSLYSFMYYVGVSECTSTDSANEEYKDNV